MGMWKQEPNFKQFEAEGFPCRMARNNYGAWCGYVRIPKSNLLWGKSYSDTVEIPKALLEQPFKGSPIDILCNLENHSNGVVSISAALNVHGGVTWAADHPAGKDDKGEWCGADGNWWFGFDCGHAWDISPKDEEDRSWTFDEPGRQYRDMEYVEAEVRSMAKQLASFNGVSA